MSVKHYTHTGCIISNPDTFLECLYVGDYGKENNIKADFLGYTKKIYSVHHTPVDMTNKLVIILSTQKGCPMSCQFCDCPKLGFKGNASLLELVDEFSTALLESGVKNGQRLNVHFARVGEPTFNKDVLSATEIYHIIANSHGFKEFHPVISTMCPKSNKNLKQFLTDWVLLDGKWNGGIGLQFYINTLNEDDRNKQFGGKSLSLLEISNLIKELPMPKTRKFSLNFAVTPQCDLNPDKLLELFSPDKCLVKITPIHATHSALDNHYEVVKDFDVFSKFEEPLVKAGFDVIVFIPSEEEDSDRITCGNAVLKDYVSLDKA